MPKLKSHSERKSVFRSQVRKTIVPQGRKRPSAYLQKPLEAQEAAQDRVCR